MTISIGCTTEAQANDKNNDNGGVGEGVNEERMHEDEPCFRYGDSNIMLMNIVYNLFHYQNQGDSNIHKTGNRVWRKGRHSEDENALVLARPLLRVLTGGY